MRRRPALALAALPLVLAGCGAGSSSTQAPSAGGASHPSASPSGMEMTHDHGTGAGSPSETASMICGDEIRGAVRRNLALSQDPVGRHTWRDHLFTCTYAFAGGDLRLSVKDLDGAAAGRAYYDHLRRTLRGATAIKGLANFGFPAFQTPQGDVVFIKDHKTLWVDATRLTAATLPSGTGREDVAYGIAAAVIGCWTE